MSLCILSACSLSFDLSCLSEAFCRLRLCMSHYYFSYKVEVAFGGDGVGSLDRASTSTSGCWSFLNYCYCMEKKFFLCWTCMGMPLEGND